MPLPSFSIPFTENQRRVVSVVLRQTEEMMDSVLGWLDRKPGVLFRISPDIPAEIAEKLRESGAQLKARLEQLRDELGIEPAVHSPAHAIYALLSTMAVTLEESQSSTLRGYGPVPEELPSRWDPEVDRLVASLDRMMDLVSGQLNPLANPTSPPAKKPS
jgi:hypothetical protein